MQYNIDDFFEIGRLKHLMRIDPFHADPERLDKIIRCKQDLTLVVMTESSMCSPVLDCVAVDAQAPITAKHLM